VVSGTGRARTALSVSISSEPCMGLAPRSETVPMDVDGARELVGALPRGRAATPQRCDSQKKTRPDNIGHPDAVGSRGGGGEGPREPSRCVGRIARQEGDGPTSPTQQQPGSNSCRLQVIRYEFPSGCSRAAAKRPL